MSVKEHVIVTGGAGMIGSNLVKRLVSLGFRVSVLDNLWRGKREYLFDEDGNEIIDMKNDFHEVDLSIPGSWGSLIKNADYVFHLADIVAGINYVFDNQGSIFRQNMLINSNVLAAVRTCNLKGFIYVGTACSFPAAMQTGIDAKPLKEEDAYPALPESAYGWSKLMGEYESLLMGKETGIPVCVLRLHNVYGTPCDYKEERGQVIPSLMRKAIRYPDESFNVWGSGAQGRAFVHVDDVVDALIFSMEKGLGEGVIQIGPSLCTSIKKIAETIVKISNKNIKIYYDTSRPEGDRGRCADYSKAKNLLGWEPRVQLYEGMLQTYRWVESKILQAVQS